MVCDDKIGKFYTQVFLPVFFQLDLPVCASLSFEALLFFPQETQKQKDDSCPGSRFEVLHGDAFPIVCFLFPSQLENRAQGCFVSP